MQLKTKKIAIFVEGHTEFHLVEHLLQEFCGHGRIRLECFKKHGPKIMMLRSIGAPEESAEILVQLTNCDGDGSVKSAILDRLGVLKSRGFTVIIGLRDLHPKPLEIMEAFKAKLHEGLDNHGVYIKICLAVREIESWVINEFTHYKRISQNLTDKIVSSSLGFDPASESAEITIEKPAQWLAKAYAVGGFDYKKTQHDANKIAAALDYDILSVSVREMSNSLNEFLTELEGALVS